VPTINQLVRKGRQRKRKLALDRALQGCPQKGGTVLRIWVDNPKKPNSGNRKLARVKLSNGVLVTAAVPGIGMGGVQDHARVLVAKGDTQDMPGVKYKIIRGTWDCTSEAQDKGRPTKTAKDDRRNSRSKYGAKRPKS
jgi:small subunit ribosomal protein S12